MKSTASLKRGTPAQSKRCLSSVLRFYSIFSINVPPMSFKPFSVDLDDSNSCSKGMDSINFGENTEFPEFGDLLLDGTIAVSNLTSAGVSA